MAKKRYAHVESRQHEIIIDCEPEDLVEIIKNASPGDTFAVRADDLEEDVFNALPECPKDWK